MIKWFMNLLESSPIYGGVPRSPKWPAFVRLLKKKQPYCSYCRDGHDLEGHHVIPYHVDPSLELVEDNVIILCSKCHLVIGHYCNWLDINPHVREECYYYGRIPE